MLLRMILVGVGLCWSLQAAAETASPAVSDMPEQVRVFRVLDGDRLLVRTRAHSLRVQLAGIDAPELDQPGGVGSQKLLEKMVTRKRVVIEAVGENTVGEPLVKMHWATHDINADMVRAGAAWVSPDGDADLRALQAEAQAKGLGIWAKDMPPAIPPWEWRTEHETSD